MFCNEGGGEGEGNSRLKCTFNFILPGKFIFYFHQLTDLFTIEFEFS